MVAAAGAAATHHAAEARMCSNAEPFKLHSLPQVTPVLSQAVLLGSLEACHSSDSAAAQPQQRKTTRCRQHRVLFRERRLAAAQQVLKRPEVAWPKARAQNAAALDLQEMFCFPPARAWCNLFICVGTAPHHGACVAATSTMFGLV